MERSYPSAEVQSLYSTAPVDWAIDVKTAQLNVQCSLFW